MKQSRLRSRVAWVAVIALVLFLLKNYNLLTVIGLTEGNFKELTGLVFAALATFGFFNDPTNSDGF